MLLRRVVVDLALPSGLFGSHGSRQVFKYGVTFVSAQMIYISLWHMVLALRQPVLLEGWRSCIGTSALRGRTNSKNKRGMIWKVKCLRIWYLVSIAIVVIIMIILLRFSFLSMIYDLIHLFLKADL